MVDTAIEELTPLIGVRAACAATGRPPASYYRAHSKPSPAQSDTFTSTTAQVAAPLARRESAQPRALSAAEREHVLEVLNSERFADMAPAAVYATLLDEGVYLCSESTMYRLLRERNQTGDRRRHATHPATVKPELVAHQPNSIWSWDITKLHGPAKWTYYYLYVILDIFSRCVVGWMVASRESQTLAERLINQTLAAQHVIAGQLTLHADRGSSMTSKPVALLLADLGVTKSHSRPHTSNDNPFSEAQGPGKVGARVCDLEIYHRVIGVSAVVDVTNGFGCGLRSQPPEPEVTTACHLPRRRLPIRTRHATNDCWKPWRQCPTHATGAGCATRWLGCLRWQSPPPWPGAARSLRSASGPRKPQQTRWPCSDCPAAAPRMSRRCANCSPALMPTPSTGHWACGCGREPSLSIRVA